MPTPVSPVQRPVPAYFVVAPRKAAILTFLTFGWYWLFCFHRNWVCQRRFTGDRSWPLARAMVAIVYFIPLVRRVQRSLRQQELELAWSPLTLFVLYLCSVMPMMLLDEHAVNTILPAVLLLVFSSLALLTWVAVIIQRAINTVEHDPNGNSNSQLTWVNWMWMAPGILFWLMVAMLVLLALLQMLL